MVDANVRQGSFTKQIQQLELEPVLIVTRRRIWRSLACKHRVHLASRIWSRISSVLVVRVHIHFMTTVRIVSVPPVTTTCQQLHSKVNNVFCAARLSTWRHLVWRSNAKIVHLMRRAMIRGPLVIVLKRLLEMKIILVSARPVPGT